MAGDVTVRVHGLEDLKRKLQEIPRALRRRVLRNALAAGARVVRDEAKRNAPVLALNGRRVPYRKPGTVRDAIRVRTSKQARRAGDVGVFVNVRPAKGADRGAKSPRDPFYWRWLEFGKKGARKREFLRPASTRLPDALRIFQQAVGRWFSKVNSTGRVQP